MPAPFRIEIELDRRERVYSPRDTVAASITLKPAHPLTASLTAGRYATAGNNPDADPLHAISAELAQEQSFGTDATAFPLSFTAPDLPAHELRNLYWWIFATVAYPEGETITEVRGFRVLTPADQLKTAQSTGQVAKPLLILQRWKNISPQLFGQLFFSIFTLGGGLAAFGAIFSAYWPQHLPFAGMRWFAALAALGGLAIGRKIWEDENPARHGRDAAAGFFVPLYSLLAAICLYVWALQPDFVLDSGHIAPQMPTPLWQIPDAFEQGSGYRLVPLVLGVLLFHLAGFAAAPRMGASPFFSHAMAVLAGIMAAASLSALVAQQTLLDAPGTAVGLAISLGLFVYLCRRPDWANQSPRFLFLGQAPLLVLALAASLRLFQTPGASLAASLCLVLIWGTMAYLGNRNLLAAMRVGSIRVELAQSRVSRGQRAEVNIKVVPRSTTVLAKCAVEISCWRSQRQGTDQETETWCEWKQSASGGEVHLVPGQAWETTLRATLPIDARRSETGTNGTWWEAYVLLEFAGKPDWSMTFPLTVE